MADRVAERRLGQVQVEPLAGQHGVGDQAVQRPFQLADAGAEVLGDVGDHRVGDVDAPRQGLRLEDRPAGRRVGGVDLDDHPAEEPGRQLVGQLGDQPRVLVGRHDDRHAVGDQGVERVQELVLRGPLGGQEVDVVDDQRLGPPEPRPERRRARRPASRRGSRW